jgi:HlyD family secretion protein
MRILVALLVLLGLSGGGYYYWKIRKPADADKPQTPTATAERGPIKLSVAATGRVVSNLDVDIKCKASGTVVKLPFDVSDAVREKELLVELDPVDEQRAVRLAQTGLNASQAKLAQAQQGLLIAEMNLKTDTAKAAATRESSRARAERARIKAQRLKETLAQSFTTQEDYDDAAAASVEAQADAEIARVRLDELKTQEAALELRRQDVKLAETEVESDRVSLENAQQRLKETSVTAPMNGVVAARNVQTGQIITSAVTNVGGGTTVLTLSDLSRVFVLASVDESEMAKVALRQPVRVTADAFPGQTLRGEVVRIATKGVNVSNVVTFEVKVEVLSDKKTRLKPEMTANLEIIAAEKEDALLVPSEAVVRKKGQRVAMVRNADGATEERQVEVGINDGLRTEIVSGLKDGEVVEIPKSGAGDRWRSGGPPNPMRMMGFGGGGGGSGGGGRSR